MSYVYRYDPLVSHLRMHGDMLRARRWNSGEGSWKHAPLLAAESTLAEGDAIFRISFWKSLHAAKSRMSNRVWSEMHILQRVREDHPYFNSFQRVDDDFLVDSAWLYWRTSPREPQQDWSRDGIPKRDIEVLDLDGQWRAIPDSTLMASPHSRLERKGFRPHFFMTNSCQPALVLWTSRLVTRPSGDTDVALLLLDPQESRHRVYNDVPVMQTIVDQFLESGGKDIPADRLRLFVIDEGSHTYDTSHLLEIPLSGEWKPESTSRRRFAWFPRRRSTQRYRYVVTLGRSGDWCWSRLDSELGAMVLSAFELLTLGETVKRYVTALRGAHEDAFTRASAASVSTELPA